MDPERWRHIERIFHSALERPSREREAFLDRECRGDEDLRRHVQSLVASLWDVADQPANRLLPDFYRAWLGGATKARALRTAQLRLLGDLRANKLHVDTPLGKILLPEHPVFWAGFALFGEPD